MENVITSSQNSIIKHVKSLHEKSKRDKLNQFFIEGYRIVKDALENNADIEFIVVSDEYKSNDIDKWVNDLINIKVYYVSKELFKEICDTENPQGIIAVINKKIIHTNDILNFENAFLVILDNVQDPGNMGTIIRTADAAGASGIIVSKGCVDIYNPKVLRSTMGSIFHLPIIKVDELNNIIDELKQNDFEIFAAHLGGKNNHFDVDMKKKCGIVIGNEANGISDEVANKCTLIKIPMPGKAESLNAAISAGIIIYEYVRQKFQK